MLDIRDMEAEARRVAELTGTERVMHDIHLERNRQIVIEAYDYANDDRYAYGELSEAAASYCLMARANANEQWVRDVIWPWGENPNTFKPTTPRRDLVKAAALIVAEIERLDRKDAK